MGGWPRAPQQTARQPSSSEHTAECRWPLYAFANAWMKQDVPCHTSHGTSCLNRLSAMPSPQPTMHAVPMKNTMAVTPATTRATRWLPLRHSVGGAGQAAGAGMGQEGSGKGGRLERHCAAAATAFGCGGAMG